MSDLCTVVQAGSGLPELAITDYGVIVTDKKGRLDSLKILCTLRESFFVKGFFIAIVVRNA